MNCIKCGVTIADSQVFCPQCLEVMEKYPVKPNVQVTIPVRPPTPTTRKRSRRFKGSIHDEQMRRMRIKLRITQFFLIFVLLAFTVLAGILLKFISDSDIMPNPGQNYSTLPSTDPT